MRAGAYVSFSADIWERVTEKRVTPFKQEVSDDLTALIKDGHLEGTETAFALGAAAYQKQPGMPLYHAAVSDQDLLSGMLRTPMMRLEQCDEPFLKRSLKVAVGERNLTKILASIEFHLFEQLFASRVKIYTALLDFVTRGLWSLFPKNAGFLFFFSC